MSVYRWQDIKSNGSKNTRAVKKKKFSDKEYLERLESRDNSIGLNMLGSEDYKEFNDEEEY